MIVDILELNRPTRSGRIYTTEIAEKAINDELIQEKIKNNCFFGTLGISDNGMIDMNNIAFLTKSLNIEDDKLTADIEILDTPCGNKVKENLDCYRFIPSGVGNINSDGKVENYELISIYIEE